MRIEINYALIKHSNLANFPESDETVTSFLIRENDH